VVVSNRVPPLTPDSDLKRGRDAPVGGLVSAVRAALEQRGGMWFGWSGVTEDRNAFAVPSITDLGPIQLATINFTRGEVNLFYNSFSNRTLWPLLHGFPAKATIRRDAFEAYSRVNRKFARALFPLLEYRDVVWVHDYHLILLGPALRELGWTGKLGFFLHTPFPPAESFSILPWARQFLEGMLAYDVVGLQTKRYARNLSDTLTIEVGGGIIGEQFMMDRQSTRIKAYPIGTDPEGFAEMSKRSSQTSAGRLLEQMPNNIVLGVDRLDYTKGITYRLHAFEFLLEHFPTLRGKVSMIQISAPSRTRVPEYLQEREQVDRLVGSINGRFSETGWAPIHYLYRSFAQEELVAFYRAARVCLVTPLRDGMNLVAKEFVASQGDDPGILVLSKFCGAVESMRDAVIVNPYDIEGTATAIHNALEMSHSERLRRWEALIKGVRRDTAQAWSDSFLADLSP
jgi:trehalose 6-phosphate synthase